MNEEFIPSVPVKTNFTRDIVTATLTIMKGEGVADTFFVVVSSPSLVISPPVKEKGEEEEEEEADIDIGDVDVSTE